MLSSTSIAERIFTTISSITVVHPYILSFKDISGDIITLQKTLEFVYPVLPESEYKPPIHQHGQDPEYINNFPQPHFQRRPDSRPRNKPPFHQGHTPSPPVLPDIDYRPPVRQEPDNIPRHKPPTTSQPRISPPVRDTTRVNDICGIR